MRVLDFLFYYLAIWFTQNKQKLTWSTPFERATYALTILTIFWIFTFWQLIEFFLIKDEYYTIPKIPLFIAGICLLFLYQYIYINKNRYEIITSPNYRQFKTKDRKGILIVILFALFSAILPFALAALLNLKHLR